MLRLRVEGADFVVRFRLESLGCRVWGLRLRIYQMLSVDDRSRFTCLQVNDFRNVGLGLGAAGRWVQNGSPPKASANTV